MGKSDLFNRLLDPVYFRLLCPFHCAYFPEQEKEGRVGGIIVHYAIRYEELHSSLLRNHKNCFLVFNCLFYINITILFFVLSIYNQYLNIEPCTLRNWIFFFWQLVSSFSWSKCTCSMLVFHGHTEPKLAEIYCLSFYLLAQF